MNQNEIAKAATSMISCIYALAQVIDPRVNHVSMYNIGDCIDFTAYIDNGLPNVEKVFQVHQFENGELYVNDKLVEVEA